MPSIKMNVAWLRAELDSLKQREELEADLKAAEALMDIDENEKNRAVAEAKEALANHILVPWGFPELSLFLGWRPVMDGAEQGMVNLERDHYVCKQAMAALKPNVYLLKAGQKGRAGSSTPGVGHETPNSTHTQDEGRAAKDVTQAVAKLRGLRSNELEIESKAGTDDYKWASWRKYIDDCGQQVTFNQLTEVTQKITTDTGRRCGREMHRSMWDVMFGKYTAAHAKVEKIICENNGMPWQVGESQGGRGWEEYLIAQSAISQAQRRKAETVNAVDKKKKSDLTPISRDSAKDRVNRALCEAFFGEDDCLTLDGKMVRADCQNCADHCYQMHWANACKRWYGQFLTLQRVDQELKRKAAEVRDAHDAGTEGFKLFEMWQDLTRSFAKAKPLHMMYGKASHRNYVENFEREWSTVLSSKKSGILNSSKTSYITDLIAALEKIDISVDSMRAFFDAEFSEGERIFGEEIRDAKGEWITAEGDWGVGDFLTDDVFAMRKKLGIPEDHVGMPFFNRVWSLQSKLPEDMNDEHWKKVTEIPLKPALMYQYQVEPLDAREHQLKGIAAILRNAAYGRNSINADAVGVGKTMQALGVAAMIRYYKGFEGNIVPPIGKRHLGWSVAADPLSEATSGKEPPIDTSRPKYPNGQVLVIVPNSLALQWQSEAYKLLAKDEWIVVQYIRGEQNAKEFWTDAWPVALRKVRKLYGGTYQNVNDEELEKKGPFIVLIASHSVVRYEGSQFLDLSGTNSRAMGPTVKKQSKSRNLSESLLGHPWAVTIIDEAHELRGQGNLTRMCEALRPRSGLMIAATATPLHNGEQDLLAIASTLGIPRVDEARKAEKELKKQLSKLERIRKTASYCDDPDSQKEAQDTAALKMNLRLKFVGEQQNMFAKFLIRRTHGSVNADMTPILNIPPYEFYSFKVGLNERERMVFGQLKKSMNESMAQSGRSDAMATKGFYGEYRMCVTDSRVNNWRKWEIEAAREHDLRTALLKSREFNKTVKAPVVNEDTDEEKQAAAEEAALIQKSIDSYPTLSRIEVTRLVHSVMNSMTKKKKENIDVSETHSADAISQKDGGEGGDDDDDDDGSIEEEYFVPYPEEEKEDSEESGAESQRPAETREEEKARLRKHLAVEHLDIRHPERQKENRYFKNYEEWKAKASTKFKVVARILRFLLRVPDTEQDIKNTLPRVNEKTQKIEFPPANEGGPWRKWHEVEDEVDGSSWKETDTKVIIYFDFLETMDIFERALNILFPELPVASMTGKLTNQVKSKTIDRFVGMNKPAELVDLASLPLTQAPRDKEDVELRVLLMSSVGNAGLNLHSARALIFMDAVWSKQTEEQIIGRMWRHPNRRRTVVYRPLMRRTTDNMLAELGANKEELLTRFFVPEALRRELGMKELDEEGLIATVGQYMERKPKKKSEKEKEVESRRKLNRDVKRRVAEQGKEIKERAAEALGKDKITKKELAAFEFSEMKASERKKTKAEKEKVEKNAGAVLVGSSSRAMKSVRRRHEDEQELIPISSSDSEDRAPNKLKKGKRQGMRRLTKRPKSSSRVPTDSDEGDQSSQMSKTSQPEDKDDSTVGRTPPGQTSSETGDSTTSPTSDLPSSTQVPASSQVAPDTSAALRSLPVEDFVPRSSISRPRPGAAKPLGAMLPTRASGPKQKQQALSDSGDENAANSTQPEVMDVDEPLNSEHRPQVPGMGTKRPSQEPDIELDDEEDKMNKRLRAGSTTYTRQTRSKSTKTKAADQRGS